ncbi:helix-turn-helix domain-containing protein [Streptomyces sp. NPDC020412]|uniref:helix-turn-helix domain-containing protein n=1 Tax=Streptomyces sp. NPDC020412 TaxID=3365073 RepID=UPI00378DDCE4
MLACALQCTVEVDELTGNQHGNGEEVAPEWAASRITEIKAGLARRLRHLRQHHPEGPVSLSALATRSGVSKRTLSAIESDEGVNVTLETLVKITGSLGIERVAYLLDEPVFNEVNSELTALAGMRRNGLTGVALRSTCDPNSSAVDEVADLLSGILESAQKAREALESPSRKPADQPWR